ncbi:hypothetical protein JCM21531_4182 [Acetivibrio straminisolvens JCM 21531]|uniref:Circadian input-output histidine kinase CikA n=2 Tax=Acetivibrio straminisolvens TaxID=253314 RepID=W4VCT0_9FIRM|nr:hypothetical protein JCM21531_4182 [Acetivibrio straminisolvens JCM 21531]
MKSKWMIKQSTLSGIILAIFFFIAVMLIWSILYMNSSIRAEQNAERRRTEFKQLGIDLADASDYLTDEARKFAVTRKIIHLERYWEEINVTRTRDKVISRLQELDSPKEELELLAKAKKYSDALVETERRSMRLVLEALGVDESDMVPEVASFKLSEEDQGLSKEDKLLKAIEIMYDARYDSDKKNIMDPIAKFQRIMNLRLESELEAARGGTARATVLQIILAFVIILAIAVLIRILFAQVTYPIRDYILKLKDFSFDDEEFRLVPKGTVELNMLAENFNELYSSFHNELVRRKKAEETMKAARDEADQANRAKSEFLASMSHEIRTPINSIIGYQYLLKNSVLSPQQRKYVENIGLAAKNLLAIINQILDFSKIEAGRMVLEEVDFNIDDVLNELMIIVGMEAERKGIEIRIKVVEDVPRFLKGDITRLKQVIMNLVSNGIKFTHEGYISVRVELIEKNEENACIKFSVTDTGIGISEEQKKLLFQAFTQGDASTSRKYGGTGLGLAICKRLVELMKGEINVESEVGKGSTFSFSLRLKIASCNEKSNGKSKSVDTEEQYKNVKILLVEDSSVNLQMTKEILENMGIDTDTAQSGEEAVKKAESNEYELILMDIRMPGMDGYEATRRIRKLERGSMPIVALTADAVEGVAQKAKEAGMNGYLTKPLEPERLLEVIRSMTNNSVKFKEEKKESCAKAKDAEKSHYEHKHETLDFDGAVSRLGGKRDKYISILKSFVELHKDDGIKIRELAASGKRDELKRFLHSLKGSAANIGALKLKDLLARLEESYMLHSCEKDAKWMNDLEKELERLIEEIMQYIQAFDSSKGSSPKNHENNNVLEDLEMLYKLLFTGDSNAKSFFEEELAYLGNVLRPEDYHDLKKKISSYEFQKALAIVDRLKQDFSGKFIK